MGKYEKKGKKKSKAKGFAVALVCLILLAVLGLFVMPQVLYSINGDGDSEAELQSQTEMIQPEETDEESLPEINGITFPAVLEESGLEVESLFQFSGINPDGGKQKVTDIAAVTVKNTSETYLKTAEITAVLADGTERNFSVSDLPAGKSALVFSATNQSLAGEDVCVALSADAVFEDVVITDGIDVTAEGMTVTLKNNSGKPLSKIDIYCRDVFGDKYFGGVTYKYTIEELSTGESTTVTASDCILGVADVVRIVVNDQK